MSATYEPIATHTTTSNVTSYTFNTIPSTYADLVVVVVGESTRTDNGRGTFINFNGDNGNNYAFTLISGNGSTTTAERVGGYSGIIGMSLARFGYGPCTNIAHIMSYANTNVYKSVVFSYGLEHNRVDKGLGLWRNTNAINSITISVGLNSIAAGTSMSIYGIKAAT